jgi:hypothetical protein
MALSNTWETAKEIYKTEKVLKSDFSKLVYRASNGFEAFVIGETEETYRIEGNGTRCNIYKKGNKSKLHKVDSSYELRKFTFSK